MELVHEYTSKIPGAQMGPDASPWAVLPKDIEGRKVWDAMPAGARWRAQLVNQLLDPALQGPARRWSVRKTEQIRQMEEGKLGASKRKLEYDSSDFYSTSDEEDNDIETGAPAHKRARVDSQNTMKHTSAEHGDNNSLNAA